MRKRAGFSLLEMLVVIALFGISARYSWRGLGAWRARQARQQNLSELRRIIGISREIAYQRGQSLTLRPASGQDWSGSLQLIETNNKRLVRQFNRQHVEALTWRGGLGAAALTFSAGGAVATRGHFAFERYLNEGRLVLTLFTQRLVR